MEDSLIQIAVQRLTEIDEYFSNPAMSQSILKTLEYSPSAISNSSPELEKKLYYQEFEHFIIGGGVDTKLTLGDAAFNLKYYRSTLEKKPSDSVMSVLHEVFEREFDSWQEGDVKASMEHLGEVRQNRIADIITQQKYRGDQKWGMEAKINAIIKDGTEYYKILFPSKGKQIISQEEADTIKCIVISFLSDPRTSKYFLIGNDVEIRKQVPIYFIYRGHECKALLDMLVINHTAKTITVVDIKTMSGNTLDFHKSLRDRRYDIQVRFYCIAAQTLFPDYKLEFPQFLVESTTTPGQPLVYECSYDLMKVAMLGSPQLEYSGKVIRKGVLGIQQLFDRLDWYQANGTSRNYLIPEEGPISIGWDGIIQTNN